MVYWKCNSTEGGFQGLTIFRLYAEVGGEFRVMELVKNIGAALVAETNALEVHSSDN